MSGSAWVDVGVGDRILLASGPALVTAIERHGVVVRDLAGSEVHVPWVDLVPRSIVGGKAQATHDSLEPWWSSLDESARSEALVRLEVVLEILPGDQHARRAADGSAHASAEHGALSPSQHFRQEAPP